MNGILDGFLVGLVLVAGFGYAAYALGPKAVRSGLLNSLSWLLRRAPAAWRLGGVCDRLTAAATGKAAGSCGGCESCASAPPAGASPDVGSDVRIPVSAIGKRPRY